MSTTTLLLWFSAPFRTPLSIDTPTLVADQVRGKTSLEEAARRLSEELHLRASSPWADNTVTSQSRYRTLREDCDQQFVSALLELNADEGLQQQMVAAISQHWGDSPLEARLLPSLLRVSLFDNTVGVIEWGLEVEGTEEQLASTFPNMDGTSFAISEAGVRYVQGHRLLPAMRAIDRSFQSAGRRDRRMAKALLRPSRFRVFTDAGKILGYSTSLTRWPADSGDTGLLWVSRLLATSDAGAQLSNAIREWTNAGFRPDTGNPGIQLRVEVGNSVVAGVTRPDDLADVALSYRKAQYIHALLDVHARNITQLYAKFLARREKVAARTLASVDAIQAHVDYIEMQLIDVYEGLQSRRHEMLQQLRSRWGVDDKVNNLGRKCDAARRRMEGLVRTRSMRYQKMVQLILGGVGVFALADLLINLASFSHSEQARAASGRGLLSRVQATSPDWFVTNSILGSVALLLLVALLLRRG